MVLPRPQVPPGPPQHSVLERCPLRCQVPSVNPPFCLSSGQVALCRSASHPHRGPPQSPCKRSPPRPDPRARHPKLPQGQAISSDLAHAPPPGPPRGSPAPPRSRSPAGPPPGPRSPTGPGRPPPPRSPSSARQRGYHGQLRHTHAAATSRVTASRRTYGTRSRPAGGGGVDPNSAAIQRARTPLPPPGGGRGLSARSDWLRAATRRAKGLGAAQVGPRGVGARGLSVTHCCAVRARHEVSVQLCGCAVSSALRGSVKRGECDVAPLEACSADGVRGSVTWSMPWGCVQWSGCSAVQCRGGVRCAAELSVGLCSASTGGCNGTRGAGGAVGLAVWAWRAQCTASGLQCCRDTEHSAVARGWVCTWRVCCAVTQGEAFAGQRGAVPVGAAPRRESAVHCSSTVGGRRQQCLGVGPLKVQPRR